MSKGKKMDEQAQLRAATAKQNFMQRILSAGKTTKIVAIAGCATLAIILLLYFGFAIYFSKHFYFGT